MRFGKVDEVWKALKKKFNLPSLTAIFDKIVEASLKITFLVLPHVVEKIKAAASKSVDFFRHHNIINIGLFDGYIFFYNEEWLVCLSPFVTRRYIKAPNSVQEGSTPLFQACFAGNCEEVRLLLEGGANVNEQNSVSSINHLPIATSVICF